MAITIDWGAKVINVPRADLTLLQSVPTEIRQLDLNAFRLELKALEESSDGMAFERTHQHNTSVTVGGVVLARVIEIINGYSVTFEDGAYAVNLVGANSNVGDVVNVNQVSVRSSNSAGLQDLSTLLASAYQGRVVVDPVKGQAGTSTPIGTVSTPVNNMTDAITIASKNGLNDILINTDITINEDLSAGYNIICSSPFNVITANAIANLTGVSIQNATVQGELDGLNVLRDSSILSVTNTSGFIYNCAVSGTIAVNGNTILMVCHSNVVGLGYPILQGDPGCSLQVRNFRGSLGLTNITDTNHSIGFGGGGRCIIDSTCTGGTIYVRGDAYEIVDNSGPGCTVVDQRTGVPAYSQAEIANTLLDSIP